MEIWQLRCFLAVAEELNFNRAAERLHVSQPALSRQIQSLEESISARLLERNSKKVMLTEAGKLFYHHARSVLDQLQRAAEESRLLASGRAGNLNVGIFGSSILDLVPRVLHRFSQAYPRVKVVLHAMDKDAQIQALRERRLTIGFNRLVPEEADIQQELVRTEPLMVAVRASNPLSEQAQIDLADILDQPLIAYPAGVRSSLINQIRTLYADYDATPVVAQEVADAPTAVALVSGGIGLSIVPKAAMNLALPGVVYRPLRCKGPASIELVCLYRKEDNPPVLQTFLQTVRSLRDCEE